MEESPHPPRPPQALVKEMEEKMVSVDCLKLEVKRLRESLNSKADEVGYCDPHSFSNHTARTLISRDLRREGARWPPTLAPTHLPHFAGVRPREP